MTGLLLLALGAAPLLAQFPAAPRSTEPITIVYPAERASLGYTDGEFVMGSVAGSSVSLQINGATVAVHRAGGFLAWVPVSTGAFALHLTLQRGATVESLRREIVVAGPPAPLPAKPLEIDPDSLWPRVDEELRPGDWLLVRMKASLGAKGEFRVGKGAWKPMRESNPALGVHEGFHVVGEDDEAADAPVEFRARSGFSSERARSPGKVTVRTAAPLVAVIKGQSAAMVKTGPGEGDLFPALGGTRFVVGGRRGAETKLLLSDGQVGWIDTKHLEFLLPGAHPPRAETDAVTIRSGDNSAVVRIGLGDRVPFSIEESDDLSLLTVRFHYTYAHTNWIVYNSSDDFVDEVRLKQETSDITAVTIRLKPGRSLWGYWPAFDGNALKLELRKPPTVARAGAPLKGIRVFLDPGHMPSAWGSTGPLGTREMDVNYAIARVVERLLLAEGAVPLMSRASPDDEVGLADRPRMAVERRADLFVSIHNNNLGSGRNPFKGPPRGYSVFYYHPHSLALARDVYEAYNGRVPLPGEELRFGNLLVCRLTAMPSILTESAYLTYPEQEALLLDAPFREKVARSIVEGLRAFMKRQAAKR